MYGLVNQAVKTLVEDKFGNEAWLRICEKVNCQVDDFVSMQTYPDKLTYDLVFAVSSEFNLTPAFVLTEFGKYWVRYSADAGYGSLMALFGRNFKECLSNLNNLHARMGLSMPHLVPPRFVFHEVNEKEYLLEYHSHRAGLSPMVIGLLEALGEKYSVKAQVSIHPEKLNGSIETFHILIEEQ